MQSTVAKTAMMLLNLALFNSLTHAAAAHPFNPHPTAHFEGYFVRLVDASDGSSLGMMLGHTAVSNSGAHAAYAAVLIQMPSRLANGTQSPRHPIAVQTFPLSVAMQHLSSHLDSNPPHFAAVCSFPSAHYSCQLFVEDQRLLFSFTTDDVDVLVRTTGKALGWPSRFGPEGWASFLPLPLHWYVHSMATEAEYYITFNNKTTGLPHQQTTTSTTSEHLQGPSQGPAQGPTEGTPRGQFMGPCKHPHEGHCEGPCRYLYEGPCGAQEVQAKANKAGTGLLHIEKNWGKAFPGEWVWAQCVNHMQNGEIVFFALAGGHLTSRFPFTWLPKFWLVGFRSANVSIAFQPYNTLFSVQQDVCNGTFSLTATQLNYRLESSLYAPPSTFASLAAPNGTDFERNLAHESYTARGTLRLYKRVAFWQGFELGFWHFWQQNWWDNRAFLHLWQPKWQAVASYHVENVALEFGGRFDCL